jgi:hypothetical protein
MRSSHLSTSAVLLVAILVTTLMFDAQSQDPEIDVFRPHAGFKVKTKVCMRCRHFFSPAVEALNQRKQQLTALNQSINEGRAAQKVLDKRERKRAAIAAAVDDPGYGLDSTDPDRVRKDKALLKCMQLVGPMKNKCLDGVLGQQMSIDDPAAVDGTPKKLRVRVPKPGGRNIQPDPRIPFKEPDGAAPGAPNIAGPFGNAFLELDETALLQSTTAMSTAGEGAGPLDDIADSVFGKTPRGQAGSGGGRDVVTAEMTICVNEASRKMIYALFRGVVGMQGQVSCVDVR